VHVSPNSWRRHFCLPVIPPSGCLVLPSATTGTALEPVREPLQACALGLPQKRPRLHPLSSKPIPIWPKRARALGVSPNPGRPTRATGLAHSALSSKQLASISGRAWAGLVLFSRSPGQFWKSTRVDREFRERVLVQGYLSQARVDPPRAHARLAPREPRVIFGLASFAEGVEPTRALLRTRSHRQDPLLRYRDDR